MVLVILHAGLGKTGSSSIQAGLAAQRDLLAEHGVFYPDFGASRIPGHWALGILWRAEMDPGENAPMLRRLSDLGPPEQLEQVVRARLAEAVARAWAYGSGGFVLLSDENLINARDGLGLRRLAAVLEQLGADLQVLAYARPDVDLFPSLVQQHLKVFGRALDQRVRSHAPKVAELRALFGTRLRLRIAAREAWVGGDVVSDFQAWVAEVAGRPLPALGPLARVNQSIPAAGCALLQELSRGGHVTQGEFATLRSAMMDSVPALAAPNLTLPQGWRARIIAKGGQAWNAVVAQSAHPPEVKARLTYPEVPGPDGIRADEITAAEIQAWVASGADPSYLRRLEDWAADQGRRGLVALIRRLAEPAAAASAPLAAPLVAANAPLVILHAGLPKTGSSSVQAGLALQRAQLAAGGVIYPALDPDPICDRIPGHWALGALWRAAMRPESEAHLIRRLGALGEAETLPARIESAVVAAIAQARSHGPDGVVILSDEHLAFANAAPGCQRLSDLIAEQGARVQVLAYARPDPALFPSHFQEELKTFGRPVPLHNLTHAPMVARLRERFGAVRLRIFAPQALRGGDVACDLWDWIGRLAGRTLPELAPLPRQNLSIPAPGCALMQRLSDEGDVTADEAAFFHLRWSMIQSRDAIAAPRLALPEGWEARIMARGHKAWNALLETAEVDPDLRSSLRLTPGGSAYPFTTAEIRGWIASHWDPAYNRALDGWITARDAPWAPVALGFLRRF